MMIQDEIDLFPLRAVRVRSIGKRDHEPAAKRRLIALCLQSGASVSGMALKAGINANQLPSVGQLWQIGNLGAFPALTNTGWLLFPPMDELALGRLARLTHVGIPRLEALQTPTAWVSARDHLPYCFDCLVLNPVDVFSPRWKQDWLDPHTAACQVPGHRLNALAPCTLRICRNLTALLHEIGKRAAQG